MEMDSKKDAMPVEKCILCNEFTLAENSISLSDEIVKATYKDLIEMILTQIISPNCKEIMLSSDSMCKYCFTNCNNVHEMDMKVKQGKLQLIERFRSSIRAGGVPPLVPFMQSPKKILNIPSSDEEESDSQTEMQHRKMNTIQEIEEELVKIHGAEGTMEIQLLSGKNEFQAVLKPSGALGKVHDDATLENLIITEIDQGIKIEAFEDDKSKVLNRNVIKSDPKDEASKQMKEELLFDSMVQRNDNDYTCMMCEGPQTVCGPGKAIMAHLKEAHNARLYICDVCGDYFKRRPELTVHMNEHIANEDGDFQCETCHRIFNNLRLFRIHKRMHQPTAKPWTCDHCGKKYGSRNLLEEHMNTHTGIRPYHCEDCGKDFASKYTFKAHQKTHETRPRPHKCPQCAKTFLSMANLLQHERTHQAIKEFACHLCEKRFASMHNLEVHSVVHTGYKPFVCNVCGKHFARRAEVRDHERTHTGERPYQCEFCGATFTQRSNLQSHKRTTHYDEKRYKCTECKKAFKRRRLLEYHIKAAHTGERPYKCTICEATFVYPEHFKKHRRIHTGEKPFRCEVCGKSFNSRDNRNAHRFVHSNKKPYECLDCGIGFMRKPLLYQHMQTEGHMSDTIVVNQPKLSSENDEVVAMSPDRRLQITPMKVTRLDVDLEHTADTDDIEIEDTKLLISDVILDDDDMKSINADETAFILGAPSDERVEHIIINGQEFHFKGEDDEAEDAETFLAATGDFSNYITPESIVNGQTQILQTKEGPVQLLAVRIPNDNGEEEEAWIKILPDSLE